MTLALDFTKPTTSDAYAVLIAELQTAIQALAAQLDPNYVTPASMPAGVKRFNPSTGLFEQWSGSVWGALSSSYVTTTATGTQTITGTANFTGTLEAGGNVVATQSYVSSALGSYAPLASPNFSGTPEISGAAIATQSYVTGLGYLTSTAASSAYAQVGGGNVTAGSTWNINVSGSSASCTGNAATATLAANLNSALSGSNNGYFSVPIGGLTIYVQWGVQSITGAATGTYSFPITFPHAVLGFVAGNNINSYTAQAANLSSGGDAISTSQYQLREGVSTAAVTRTMIAIGY